MVANFEQLSPFEEAVQESRRNVRSGHSPHKHRQAHATMPINKDDLDKQWSLLSWQPVLAAALPVGSDHLPHKHRQPYAAMPIGNDDPH